MLLKTTVNKSRAWKKLESHAKKIKKIHMREMFEKDKDRAQKFSLGLENLHFDYSKNRISEKTITYLLNLAKSQKLKEKINAMFSGEKINITEKDRKSVV